MIFNSPQRRRNGKIDKLPLVLKESVDKMLLAGCPYREIVEYLGEHEVQLSKMAVSNYANKFLATTQQLRMAQDNYKVLLSEIERCPNMDTSEGLIRVLSSQILNQLSSVSPEDWQDIKLDKLITGANALIRVTSHKRRSDTQNKTDIEKALDEVSAQLFTALKDEQPETFAQLNTALKRLANDNSNRSM